jgi:hypothetical protein
MDIDPGLATAVVGGIVIPILILILGVWKEVRKKFETMNDKLAEKLDQAVNKILSKFEEHEKEDNRRFDQIKNDIWDMRVLNAAKDGVIMSRNRVSDQKDSENTNNTKHLR